MSIEQMRQALAQAYSGPNWPYKVKAMSEKQVFATYQRLRKSGRIKQ